MGDILRMLKSRVPFAEELGIGMVVDLDASLVRLKRTDGLILIVPFDSSIITMENHFDIVLVEFSEMV